MSSQKINLGSRDLISGLPDSLICHILSFISTKEAASTSVLAKRWRYLFALAPNLDFDDSIYLNPVVKILFPWITTQRNKIPKKFMNFVDRVLILQGKAPLSSFSLKCKDFVDSASVIGWIRKVLERGLSDLDLHITTESDIPLPSEMFLSKTLVRLKIEIRDVLTIDVRDVCVLTIDVEEIFLPKVKTLCLGYVMIKKSVFVKLLLGCQVLEELVLNDFMGEITESCSVSSRTLKRLIFHRSRYFDENHSSVSFNIPNLVYLEYFDTIADKYPKVKFGSLVEACIGLRMTHDQIYTAKFSNDDLSDPEEEMVGKATEFFMGICNVKILYLSDDTLEVLNYCCKPMPEFNNLIHLTIKTDLDVSWESLPTLLNNCPTLETLVFEGLHHKETIKCGEVNECLCKPRVEEGEEVPSCLSSSPVKVLKILKFGESNDGTIVKQIEQVKHFLETMPNLEEMILYYDSRIDENVFEVSNQLQKLPRVASPKCKIQVISDIISLSVTVRPFP